MRLKVRTQFPSSHYSFCFPLCFLASIFVTTSISRIPVVYSARRIEEPLQSCLEQYLSGNGGGDTSSAAVMPLMSGGGQTSSSSPVVWLECQFPQFSGQSLNAYVTTVVHNALERFYILGTQKRTVEYQIRDWQFLRDLVAESDDCTQQLYIRWPENRATGTASGDNGVSDSNSGVTITAAEEAEEAKEDLVYFSKENPPASWSHKSTEFMVESLFGRSRTFTMNSSNIDPQSSEIILLEKDQLPILHIHPPKSANERIEIRLTSLICQKRVVDRERCLFEMSSDSEFVRLDVPAVLKAHPSTTTFIFAFRTSRQSGKLMSIGLENGHQIDVDLIDGYLILVNYLVHPVRLLSDGNWHIVYVDLALLSLRFDGPSQTAISLLPSTYNHAAEHHRSGSSGSEGMRLVEINLLLNGEITALRLRKSAGSQQLLCAGSELLTVRQQALPNTYRISVCSPGEEEKSSCNCLGPNSALNQGPGITACSTPKPESAFHLSRQSDKLAFFLIPNFLPRSSISIVFKSEAETGLLFFGTSAFERKDGYSRGGSSDKLAPISNRIQAYFVVRTIFVASCNRMTNGDELCYSCSIARNKDINSGDWIRVSVFYHQNYQFMTIDDQICLLSPNSATIDPSELYKVSHAVSNVLLVGGTYYAKHAGLRNLVNPGFRRDFYENTREKPPSLKGCIAEVRLASQLVDLEDILVKQIHKISAETTADSSSSIFSVEQGCNECPSRCNGASCSIAKNPSDVLCNCASIYALVDVNTGACQKSPGNSESLINAGLASLAAALRLTFIGEIDVYLTPELFRTPLVSQKGKKTVLNKIWMLIRLPELNSKLHTFIRLGDIKISVGNNGKQVVVDLADYGIQEEFSLPEFDGRLHLLSIEKNPSIGTSLDKKLLTIRLDKNERYHELDEIPIYSTSNDELQIYPYALDHDDHGVDGKGGFSGSDRGGCLSEFAMSYEQMDETVGPSPFSQADYVSKVVDKLATHLRPNDYSAGATSHHFNQMLISKNKCGIRDPLFWFGNSSNYGAVTDYTPEGIFPKPSLATIITTLLALILLFIFAINCFKCIFKRKQKKQTKLFKPDDLKKFGNDLPDEKKPLNEKEFFDDRQRWNSNTSASNAETAYEDFQTAPLRTTEPLVIDKLKSSPKSATFRYRIQQPPIIRQTSQSQNSPANGSSGSDSNSPHSFPSTMSSTASPSAAGISPTGEPGLPAVRVAAATNIPQLGSPLNQQNQAAPMASHDEL